MLDTTARNNIPFPNDNCSLASQCMRMYFSCDYTWWSSSLLYVPTYVNFFMCDLFMTIIHSSCICLFTFNLIWRLISLSVPTCQLFYVFYDNNAFLLYLLQLLQLWLHENLFFLFLCQLYVFMTIIHSCICVFIYNCSQQQNPVLLFCKWRCTASQQASVCSSNVIRWWLYIVVYCCSHSALCDGTIFGYLQLRRICVHVTGCVMYLCIISSIAQ